MESQMQAAALVYKVTCAQSGRSDLGQLTDDLSGRIQKNELEQILGNKQLFVVCNLDGKKTVVATTQLRHCRARNCPGCSNLHLCKFYLLGEDCPHNRGRRVCCFSHDLYSDHNNQLLRQHYLQELNREELCTLLLQSTLLPPVCFTYNRGAGEFGFCPDKDTCRRLHICEKYLRGTCYRGTEICLFHIKNYCKQGNRCGKVHFHLPYRWEFKDGQGWSQLTDNEAIEQDYCDPSKSYSGGNVPVHFDTMTRNSVEVRRISTVSSATQPNFILTTRWVWYWEDEFGHWTQYASSEGADHSASITSEELEKKYHDDNSGTIAFTAGRHSYELSMQDMIQSNQRFGTKRLVRRRPVFVSADEVRKIKSSSVQTRKSMPHHWDKLNMPETGFKRITLESSSKDYTAIADLFRQTMTGFRVTSIERVQNIGLWEVFQWQADQMRKNNSGRTNEKILFHGTDSKHVDAICQQNFDWRICGTHGTAYGKGSYFARDARYSHNYTSPSSTRSMFACRVLIGDYTTGTSSYVRPPAKEDDPNAFYDSCVNHVSDPSVFVVFEKHQVYPEYLLQYTEGALSPAAHVSQSISPQGSTSAQGLSKAVLSARGSDGTTVAIDTPSVSNARVLQASGAAQVVPRQAGPTRHTSPSVTATSAKPQATNVDSRFSSSAQAGVPVFTKAPTLVPRSHASPGATLTSASSADGLVKSVSEKTLGSYVLPSSALSTSMPVRPRIVAKPASLTKHSVTPKKEVSDATQVDSAVSKVTHTPVSHQTPQSFPSSGPPTISELEAAARNVRDRTSVKNPVAKVRPSHWQTFADSTGGKALSETSIPPSRSKYVRPLDDLRELHATAEYSHSGLISDQSTREKRHVPSPASRTLISPTTWNSGIISDLNREYQSTWEKRQVPSSASRTLSSPSSDAHPSATSVISPSPANITARPALLLSGANEPQLAPPMPRRVRPSAALSSDATAQSPQSHVGAFSDLIDYFQKLSNQK